MNCKLTQEQMDFFLEEYKKGELTYTDMSNQTKVNVNTIRTFINRSISRGLIERRDRKYLQKDRLAKYFKERAEEASKKHVTDPNVDVDCNKVWRTCKFGCADSGHCDFRACVGRSRIMTSPDPHHCHDYEKLTGKRKRGVIY